MRSPSAWICASLLLLLALGGCAVNRHPALGVIDGFESARAPYLLKPYFANLYSLKLLRRGGCEDRVERYLSWYLDRLNYPDAHGLTGSIYDFRLDRGGREEATGGYDSVDGYAATFMILLDEFEQRTGRRDLIIERADRVRDIAWLLLHLQEGDGLVRALPDRDAKYLMDNCEVYGGLIACNALWGRLGWPDGDRYLEAARAVRRGVNTTLYAPAEKRFHWALDAAGPHPSDWERFYPDALAQLFPVLYGIIDPDSEQARHIWREFAVRYDPRDGSQDVPPHLRTIIELTRERVSQ